MHTSSCTTEPWMPPPAYASTNGLAADVYGKGIQKLVPMPLMPIAEPHTKEPAHCTPPPHGWGEGKNGAYFLMARVKWVREGFWQKVLLFVVALFRKIAQGFAVSHSKETSKDKPKQKGKKGKKEKAKAEECEEKSEQPKDNSIIRATGAPKTCCHITYSLLPDRLNAVVDVAYWEDVAKVYCLGTSAALQCKKTEKISWAAFTVTHTMHLSTTDIINLVSHKIIFAMSNNATDISSRAQIDITRMPKKFHVPPGIEKQHFVELQEEPHARKTSLSIGNGLSGATGQEKTRRWKRVVRDMVAMFRTKESITALQGTPLEGHWRQLIDTIRRISSQSVVADEGDAPPRGKSVGKKEKKNSKKKKDEIAPTQVDGESFFVDDKPIQIELKPNSNAIAYIGAIISTYNLMTEKQENFLCPLVIRLNAIKNLPVNILQQNNISEIYAAYKIMNFNDTVTKCKPCTQEIVFNSDHVMLTFKCNCIDFMEFLQTGQLAVQIFGKKAQLISEDSADSVSGKKQKGGDKGKDAKKEKPKKPKGSQKGSKKKDKKKQDLEEKDISIQQPTATLLGVAEFDLSELLVYRKGIEMISSIKNPNSLKQQDPFPRVSDKVTASESNILSTSTLIQHETVLEIFVRLRKPPDILPIKALYSKLIYNKILLVLSDTEIIQNVMCKILATNASILGKLLFPINYMHNNKETQALTLQLDFQKTKRHTATGYIFENNTKTLIFVEGLSEGIIYEIWKDFKDLSPSQGYILYNSDLIFASRMYEPFLAYGGFYTITLKTPMEILLAKSRFYIQGMVPGQCWKATQLLDALLSCKTMEEVCKGRYLPSPSQLISLDLEFGTPMHWLPYSQTIVAKTAI